MLCYNIINTINESYNYSVIVFRLLLICIEKNLQLLNQLYTAFVGDLACFGSLLERDAPSMMILSAIPIFCKSLFISVNRCVLVFVFIQEMRSWLGVGLAGFILNICPHKARHLFLATLVSFSIYLYNSWSGGSPLVRFWVVKIIKYFIILLIVQNFMQKKNNNNFPKHDLCAQNFP